MGPDAVAISVQFIDPVWEIQYLHALLLHAFPVLPHLS
jgi:hypothetical protein